MRKLLERLRDGFLFRYRSFRQCIFEAWRCSAGASDIRDVASDYLWRSVVSGHLTGGLAQEIFMEMEERRRFDDGKIGRAPDFFLDNAASLILAGMRDAGRKSGYLPEFIEASVRHFDRCGECRRSVRDAVRLNVRMRKELRGPFDHLSDEESDRFIAGIMERIRNLPEDRPRGLRLMKGGRDGAKRP